MQTTTLIQQQVQQKFVSGEYNCAMTVLETLAMVFEVPLSEQALAAAQAMPGAGGVGGLCGLVSGALMFVGVWAGEHGVPRAELKPVTVGLVEGLEARLGSILCRDLSVRPCERLAVEVLEFAVPYLRGELIRNA